MCKTITPKPITKEYFLKFGDLITTKDIEPITINDGYAKRFDNIAKLDTSKENGKTTISIFSALKRTFPMKVHCCFRILDKISTFRTVKICIKNESFRAVSLLQHYSYIRLTCIVCGCQR